MGLRLVSCDGMLIRRAQQSLLRCFACSQLRRSRCRSTNVVLKRPLRLVRDLEKLFCPACGNSTLKRCVLVATLFAPHAAPLAACRWRSTATAALHAFISVASRSRRAARGCVRGASLPRRLIDVGGRATCSLRCRCRAAAATIRATSCCPSRTSCARRVRGGAGRARRESCRALTATQQSTSTSRKPLIRPTPSLAPSTRLVRRSSVCSVARRERTFAQARTKAFRLALANAIQTLRARRSARRTPRDNDTFKRRE